MGNLGRSKDCDAKAFETVGAMDEGAEDSLGTRVSYRVKECDTGICVTIGLTFSMPPKRKPTCIQLGDGIR